MDPIQELQCLYQDRRLILFVGAGASMSVSWGDNNEHRGPSWSELVNEAIRQLGFEDPRLIRVRGNDLQILEYYRIEKGNFAPLTNWLYAKMRAPDEALEASPIHQALSDLSHCDRVYTTNFDDFIERTFARKGRAARVVRRESDMGRSEVEIVKFHGDWDSPERMVFSESQYQDRLKLANDMDHKLRADALGRAVLFLGYSFSDWNVSYLFRLINDQFSNLSGTPTGSRAYIVFPDPSAFEIKLFRARNITVIPVSRNNLTAATAKVLQRLAEDS